MASKRDPFSVHLTEVMEAFLDQLVKEGRALNPREALRGLVWQEIKLWERKNHRAFETAASEASNDSAALGTKQKQ